MNLRTRVTPLRAANKPRAGMDSQNPVVWTNDNLERLHGLDLIPSWAEWTKTAGADIRACTVRGNLSNQLELRAKTTPCRSLCTLRSQGTEKTPSIFDGQPNAPNLPFTGRSTED
jgi:hypothetical protein